VGVPAGTAAGRRLGDDAIREWAELAQLDAIDLGEQLGLLSDVETAGRRAAVWRGDQDQRSALCPPM
jgi:hypothetical protein